MTELEKYYNKFNEDKRLTRRHGKVEYITSMKYIHQCIDELIENRQNDGNKSDTAACSEIRILDIGAAPADTVLRWRRRDMMLRQWSL